MKQHALGLCWVCKQKNERRKQSKLYSKKRLKPESVNKSNSGIQSVPLTILYNRNSMTDETCLKKWKEIEKMVKN